jgi:hypothetical protein
MGEDKQPETTPDGQHTPLPRDLRPERINYLSQPENLVKGSGLKKQED